MTVDQKLSRREQQVVEMLIDGLTLEGVSRKLGRAQATVATHARRAKAKLRAKTTLQAAVMWARYTDGISAEYASWGRRK